MSLSSLSSFAPSPKNYIIATSPRTGSELLCEYLSRTEIAGKPGEHYFPKRFPNFYQYYNVTTFADYDRIIRAERTTPNQVFGTKLIAGDILQDFLTILRQNTPQAAALTDDLAILQHAFPNLHFIRLIRQDRLRQAISLYRAEATGIWHNTGKQAAQPTIPYDYQAIKSRYDKITVIEQQWDQFFTRHQLTPLQITYETFIQSPLPTLTQILHHLQLTLPPHWQPTHIANQKMPHTQTEAWIARFQAEDYPA